MEDKNKLLQEIMKHKMPDMSHIKPPTEHAVNKMIKNLRMAAKTVRKQ